MNIFCSTIMSSSLYLLPNSISTRQHWEIVKFKITLWTAQTNHRIKCFWFVLCINILKFLPKKSNYLNGSPCPLPPKIFLYIIVFWFDGSLKLEKSRAKFKLLHKLNFNIVKANWKVLSSQFIFFLCSFLWMTWIWSLLNGMKVHPWKFLKDEIHYKNNTYDLISSMKCNSFINFLFT